MRMDQIIQYLKEADGYLSGEVLSQRLKISRSAIWKYIEECRQQGYVIEAVPHAGYVLKKIPDKLYPREIQHTLNTQMIGRDIVYEEEVTSTMDTAVRLALEGARHGTVVCSESQTRGKGRLGRTWQSPKGKGLYFSVILRPTMALNALAPLTLVAAVAVCEALREVTTLPVQIKWPNDLLIQRQKVAGILTELNAEMDRVRFVVLGVGINVNTPLKALPEEATSLKVQAGQTVDRLMLMRVVLSSLDQWVLQFQAHGFSEALKRWKALSVTLGQRVRVTSPQGQSIEGVACEVDPQGVLMIRQEKGGIMRHVSGDVCLL